MIAPTASDRALAAMRALVRSFFPQLVYFYPHEYSVAESDGTTFSGTPTDATISPPLTTRVPYSPSLAGSSCVVPVGTLAHVVFVNADPSKPRCVGFDLPAIPTQATVDASSTMNVGPSASTVQVGSTFAATPITAVGHFPRYGDGVSIVPAVGPPLAVGVLTFTGPAGPVSTGKS